MSTADSTGAACPSCGRFVGPLEQCPHCGASVRKRLPLRYIRYASIVIAVVGIAALLYAVSGMATPRVQIADVEATMNYAYVRVEGQVTRGPNYNPDTQELKFYVGDSTGEILVTSFRATTRSLLEQNKIPVAGDRVSAEGTLRVRDEFVSLNLAAPDKLTLTHPSARAVKIGEISRDHNLQIVTITGDVREIRTPYKGLTLISVGDATGEIDVALSADIIALSGDIAALQSGDAVQVSGAVTFYKDAPQLALTHARDLAKVEGDTAPLAVTQIGDLDAARVGARVSVVGTVASAKKFSQGLRVTLDDGSGTLTLLLWQDTLAQIANAEQLKTGARVQARGKLSQYRGDLEVTPQRGSDVQIAAATASAETPSVSVQATRTPILTPAQRTLASLSAVDENRTVVISGRITTADSFSKGVRYTLDDGTGKITLLLWSDVLGDFKDSAALKVGARVQATGKVNLFNHALEIVPAQAGDVTLLAQSVLPTPAPRTIASLTSNDVGAVTAIRGKVTGIEDFSKGKYVTVSDGTGEIRVTVFSDVLNALAPKNALVVGAKISVRGEVNLYRGKLEVVADKGGLALE